MITPAELGESHTSSLYSKSCLNDPREKCKLRVLSDIQTAITELANDDTKKFIPDKPIQQDRSLLTALFMGCSILD